MSTSRLVAGFAVAVLLITTNAPRVVAACDTGSTAGWLRFTNGPSLDYNPCYMVHAGANTITIGISAVPFTKAKLSIPNPPGGTIVGENWFFPHTGDHASGVEIALPSCSSDAIVNLGEVYVDFPSDPAPCSSGLFWNFGASQILVCSGLWLPVGSTGQNFGSGGQCCGYWQACFDLPPFNLYPPDGATNILLNTDLWWIDNGGINCAVDMGTQPDCSQMQTYMMDCNQDKWDVQFLQPATTYYWRVRRWNPYDPWCGGTYSAVHHFTTVATVAVEPVTWGHVKSMYRN